MKADQTRKHALAISPIGCIEHAWLEKPQEPHPKNQDGDPKYKIILAMNPKDTAVREWCSSIKDMAPDGGKLPFRMDKEHDVLIVKFASLYKPALVDAKRQPLPEKVIPSRGAQVKVAYVPHQYEGFGGGVNLYLHGVQVLVLVQFEAKTLPFADEDGYVATSSDTAGADTTTTETEELPF